MAPLLLGCAALAAADAAIDALADPSQPAASEARLRAALPGAQGDDALRVRIHLARMRGLQGDFADAREQLAALAPAVVGAAPELRVRHALEWGRAHASAAHPPDAVTPADRAAAQAAYADATALARRHGLDALAVDALHMQAIASTDAAAALTWDREALALAEGSADPAAQRWRASLHHNIGYALHGAGRLPEALAAFEAALALRRAADPQGARTRVARWMVAWTLRGLGRTDEALAWQQALEADGAAAGQPDRHVFAELALLHAARGDAAEAARYAALRDAR